MQYKTIVLELIQEIPDLHARLVASKSLLSTMERLAKELRTNHLQTLEELWKERPGTSELQVRSEAFEIALEELRLSLSTEVPANDHGPLTLDDAMSFLKRHTPRG